MTKYQPSQNWWGYVTNGGTEGNMYGLYLARETYRDAICYFSSEAHYALGKILHILSMRFIMVSASSNGEIDYKDLEETLRLHRDTPAIVFTTSGTTMKEAKDDVGKIKSILQDLSITRHFIHMDAALCGFINPFLDPRPSYDFADGADSISISGHKFLGCPIPCGIVIAKKDNTDKVTRAVKVLGAFDTTISGSRNGYTPMVLWYALKKLGRKGLAEKAMVCVKLAEYTEKRLKERFE